MRHRVLYGLMALTPAVLGQSGEDVAPDALIPDSELVDGDFVSDNLGGFVSRLATSGDGDGKTAVGPKVELSWSITNKAVDDETGYWVVPPALFGKGLKAFSEYRLRGIRVTDSGPCNVVYSNVSNTEPPPPEGTDPWNKVQTMALNAGDKFSFRGEAFGTQAYKGAEHSIIKMKYVYCGAPESLDPKNPDKDDKLPAGRTCNDYLAGDLSKDILSICCGGTSSWDQALWDNNDMDTYMKNALEGWNNFKGGSADKSGWQTSIMNTFAQYDMEAMRPASELQKDGKKQPTWIFNCANMDADCKVTDLSDQEACVLDPKRVLALRALQNLADTWAGSRTKFSRQAVSDIVLKVPDLTSKLFPVPDAGFNAPGDYNDATWTMVGGGIVGLLATPFGLIKAAPIAAANPYIAASAAVVGGIMWLVGLALGPIMSAAKPDEDKHFQNFARFSAEDAAPFVDRIFDTYEQVFGYLFVSKPKEPVNVDKIMGLFKGGALIPNDNAKLNEVKDWNKDVASKAQNNFLAPLINLAWQKQRVFIVKLPKGGIEFWRHRNRDSYNPFGEQRTSITFDPCGKKGSKAMGIRFSYQTSDRDGEDRAPEHWIPWSEAERAACNEDGSGYAFMAWNNAGQIDQGMFADYGFKAVKDYGFDLKQIAMKAEVNQASLGFNGGVPKSWEERLEQMTAKAANFVNDPTAVDPWILPLCDLTVAHDTAMGLIPVEGCKLKKGQGGTGQEYPDEWICPMEGIRDWCMKNQRDKNNHTWPFKKED